MVAVGGSLFSGGEKKEEDSPLVPSVEPVAVLCTGNGSLSWLPLECGNSWIYKNRINSSRIRMLTITGTAVYSGNLYYRLQTDIGGMLTEQFLRTVSNGDIHCYNPSTQTGELYLPHEASAGQVITLSGSQPARTVGSVTENIETVMCKYSNVMRIDHFANGLLIGSECFQRGVGQVYATSNYWDLVSITLR
jgi:hypothetical protein